MVILIEIYVIESFIESDFCVNCASYITTLMTIDSGPFLLMKFNEYDHKLRLQNNNSCLTCA